MPDLSVPLSDDDLAQLEQMGVELGITARKVAQGLIHRNLARTTATPRPPDRQRASDRAYRQLEITRRISRRKKPTLSMAERQAMALEFNTSLRTITRDLGVAQRALKTGQPQQIAS